MKTSKRIYAGMAFPLVLAFTGCGSGGSSSDTSPVVTDTEVKTGYLVDSAIEGVDYAGSLGSSGVTDRKGAFHFKTGETVSFSLGTYPLGAIELGNVRDGIVVTPVDLVEGKPVESASAEMIADPEVQQLLQLLQSADDNRNPADGIRIDDAVKTALSGVDPDSVQTEEDIADVLDRPAVSVEDATTHFEETIREMEQESSSSTEQASSESVSEQESSAGDEDQAEESTDENSVPEQASSSSEGESGSYVPSGSEEGDDEDSDDDEEDGKYDSTSSYGDESGSSSSVSSTPTVSAGGAYTLLAWNDLGMHCMDGRDFSVFSILPPYNTLNAQLIRKEGTSGKHVTSGVTITYSAAPSLSGRYNTTSLVDDQNNPKTNFWDFVGTLFNANPTPDTGLTGNHTPDLTERQLEYVAAHNWWEASGLPITPYNDDGTKNYYPMVDVTAKDASGNVLAITRVVLPVSDEMDCRACHGSTSGYADAKPSAGWENDADPEKDFKWNVLRLHDQKHPTAVSDHQTALKAAGYNGYNDAGLYATAKAGNPVLCATCHASNALPGTGIAGIKPLTEALHGKHAEVKDPTNGQTLASLANRGACYRCHPGATTKCLRGAMGKQSDIQCQSCHGNMHAVGTAGRKGWLDMPNCQSCHQNGRRYATAVTDMNRGTLRAALDNRFATNTNTPMNGVSLYRYSKGHGKMQCSACHGSTHAIYPSSHAEDNLQSIAVQGHEGTIAECTACHDATPRTVSGGPHGMHSVGQYWVGAHEDVAEHNSAQCKSCHGADYRGSDLSKTFSARSFSTEWGTKNFSAGHKVSCYDCHNGPGGD